MFLKSKRIFICIFSSLFVSRLFPARPNEDVLTDKCEFCFDFKIGVNIISVCVLFHKNHA